MGGNIFLFFAFPITAGLTFLSEPVIELIAGKAFIIDPLIILFICLGFIFLGMYGIYSYIIDLSEKTYIALIILIITGALNVILNIVLIPVMDIMGAALATLITYAVQTIIILYLSRNLINVTVKFNLLFIFKCFLATMVMILVLGQINIANQVSYVVASIIIGSLVYFFTIGIMIGFNYKKIFKLLP